MNITNNAKNKNLRQSFVLSDPLLAFRLYVLISMEKRTQPYVSHMIHIATSSKYIFGWSKDKGLIKSRIAKNLVVIHHTFWRLANGMSGFDYGIL